MPDEIDTLLGGEWKHAYERLADRLATLEEIVHQLVHAKVRRKVSESELNFASLVWVDLRHMLCKERHDCMPDAVADIFEKELDKLYTRLNKTRRR